MVGGTFSETNLIQSIKVMPKSGVFAVINSKERKEKKGRQHCMWKIRYNMQEPSWSRSNMDANIAGR